MVGVVLPDGDLFRPLLADLKQPRFYASFRSVRFRGRALPAEEQDNEVNIGIVGLGGDFGLWGLRRPRGCDGFRVNLFGAVFSQFNLDTPSSDLINSDFIAGVPLVGRWGRWSARVRLYHQSSHLGDEFLLNNPGVVREDLSFEAVDALLSIEERWWRLYGGGGGLLFPGSGLRPWILQGGAEMRGPSWAFTGNTRLLPVAGVDVQSFEERQWSPTYSAMGGIELVSPGGTRRIRLLATYLRGFVPFGQFFSREKEENFGVILQFEF